MPIHLTTSTVEVDASHSSLRIRNDLRGEAWLNYQLAERHGWEPKHALREVANHCEIWARHGFADPSFYDLAALQFPPVIAAVERPSAPELTLEDATLHVEDATVTLTLAIEAAVHAIAWVAQSIEPEAPLTPLACIASIDTITSTSFSGAGWAQPAVNVNNMTIETTSPDSLPKPGRPSFSSWARSTARSPSHWHDLSDIPNPWSSPNRVRDRVACSIREADSRPISREEPQPGGTALGLTRNV